MFCYINYIVTVASRLDFWLMVNLLNETLYKLRNLKEMFICNFKDDF